MKPLTHIPLVATLLATVFLASAAAAQPVTGDGLALRGAALDALNADREAHELPPLEADDRLDAIAQAHAEDMLARDYFAHESPEGETVGERFREAGGSPSPLVAENLATCSGCRPPLDAGRVRAFQQNLMESPSHRETILRDGLERFGYGIAGSRERGRIVAVQTFAGPGTPRGEGAEHTETLAPDARVEAFAQAVNARRSAAGVGALEPARALVVTARALADAAGGTDLPELDIRAALPEDALRDYAGFTALAAACTGCGASPTRADVRDFVTDWSERSGETLTDPRWTALGAALRADGDGRKIAIVVLGETR